MYRQFDLQKDNRVIREYLPEKHKVGDITRGWTIIRAHGFSSDRLETIELSNSYMQKSLTTHS